jgi:nitrogenase subunit NifH
VIPRSELVQESEIDAKTVVEKFPDSEQAKKYFEISKTITNNQEFVVPEPMDAEKFEEFFRTF